MIQQRIREILKDIQDGRLTPKDGQQLIYQLRNQKTTEDSGLFSQHSENSCKSIVLNKPISLDDLELKEIVTPEPGPHEVQILVKAFSLNFGDFLCVKGLYPTMPEYPFTPGFEVSGVISKLGSGVTRFNVGDEVVALMGEEMGAHSSIVVTREELIVKKPQHVSFEDGCAFPVVFITMEYAFRKAALKPGEKILIQTAAGGTGLIGVQMALKAGAEIFGTASSQLKLDYLKKLGVHHTINYVEKDFAKTIRELTNGYGVDVVINTLSGDGIQKGLDLLASNGRYIELAVSGLKSAKNIDVSKLVNNQTFFSIDLRRFLFGKLDDAQSLVESMGQALDCGNIKPTVNRIFAMKDIREAYHHMENRSNIGKIVVTVDIPKKDVVEQKTEKLKPAAIGQTINRDVAIVGISCRFPGAYNIEDYWKIIRNGDIKIEEVPSERWDLNGVESHAIFT